MTLRDITRDSILKAMAEFDALGQEKFLSRYRYGAARNYLLREAEKEYDSEAIIGVAHKHATGEALTPADFSGGAATVVQRLRKLGFQVERRDSRKRVRTFGHIPGIEVHETFDLRIDLARAGLHKPLQAGISGSGKDGADSIIVSGGYRDDKDLGDTLIYTGHGGRDSNTGRQIADQRLDDPGNAGLIRSQLDGLPVRVIRAPVKDSPYAPEYGLRYDGLYQVMRHWTSLGIDGYRIVQFELRRLVEHSAPWDPAGLKQDEPVSSDPVNRRYTPVERLLRDAALTHRVKALHEYRCQICRERINLPGGPYAEGAHIRPLGRPHDGPDRLDNLLCLCPNDHVRFDNGGLVIMADFTVVSEERAATGQLHVVSSHRIDPSHLAYHRGLWLD